MRFRPATREERQLTVLWVAAAASAVVLRPVWLAVAPHLRPCTFRELTGVPCPTCGTTRTAVALLELDPATAFFTNPLAAAVGTAFLLGGMIAAAWLLSSSELPAFDLRWNRWWAIAVVAVFAANWAYLIVTR
jgi:hypothetical protein